MHQCSTVEENDIGWVPAMRTVSLCDLVVMRFLGLTITMNQWIDSIEVDFSLKSKLHKDIPVGNLGIQAPSPEKGVHLCIKTGVPGPEW